MYLDVDDVKFYVGDKVVLKFKHNETDDMVVAGRIIKFHDQIIGPAMYLESINLHKYACDGVAVKIKDILLLTHIAG